MPITTSAIIYDTSISATDVVNIPANSKAVLYGPLTIEVTAEMVVEANAQLKIIDFEDL